MLQDFFKKDGFIDGIYNKMIDQQKISEEQAIIQVNSIFNQIITLPYMNDPSDLD